MTVLFTYHRPGSSGRIQISFSLIISVSDEYSYAGIAQDDVDPVP